MRSTDATTRPPAEDIRALPRGVIRLLRSGALDEARIRRVLEVHGLENPRVLARVLTRKVTQGTPEA